MADRTQVHAAVDRALDGHPDEPEWEELVLATIRLTEAHLRFDAAKRAYVAKHPRQP